MNDKCPYADECGILSSCDETCCRVKELFDDFYKTEKLYTDSRIHILKIEKENKRLKGELAKLKELYIDMRESHESHAENFAEYIFNDIGSQKLKKIINACDTLGYTIGNDQVIKTNEIIKIIESEI